MTDPFESVQSLDALQPPGGVVVGSCPLNVTPTPENELARQAALDRYGMVGTLPEQDFNDITAIVAQLCNTPLAFISLVSGDIQWLKAEIGVGTQELPRQGSFCGHTILIPDRVLIVPDTRNDPRFVESPFVTAHPYIRFYAGAPLVTPQGYAIGSLCAVDVVPRTLDDKQRESLQSLARQVVAQMELRWSVRELQTEVSRRQAVEYKLQEERQKSEQLISNMLPAGIAQRLRNSPGPIADRVDRAVILFADIVNFTPLAAQVEPTVLVCLLNELFSTFDRLVLTRDLDKIKTIGDAYMVAGGLVDLGDDFVASMAELALEMQQATAEFGRTRAIELGLGERAFLELRIGIEVGPVVAGTIGTVRQAYDLWGDAVNLASRLESQGEPGKIQIGPRAYQCLRDRYDCTARGLVSIKGKGDIETYWLEGVRETP